MGQLGFFDLNRRYESLTEKNDPLPEFKNPPTNRFIADHQSALSQKILDIPIAQREPEVEPDRLLNDRWWESVAAVADSLHPVGYRATRRTATSRTT